MLAHALFSIIYQTFMAERRALHWRENDLPHERAGNFIHFLHLINPRNISFNPLDWLIADEPSDEVSAQVSQQPSSKLDRNVNLKRKRQCKIWRFSWPEPVVSLFCSLACTKTRYVIIGLLVWPWTKPWTIPEVRVLCKPHSYKWFLTPLMWATARVSPVSRGLFSLV